MKCLHCIGIWMCNKGMRATLVFPFEFDSLFPTVEPVMPAYMHSGTNQLNKFNVWPAFFILRKCPRLAHTNFHIKHRTLLSSTGYSSWVPITEYETPTNVRCGEGQWTPFYPCMWKMKQTSNWATYCIKEWFSNSSSVCK